MYYGIFQYSSILSYYIIRLYYFQLYSNYWMFIEILAQNIGSESDLHLCSYDKDKNGIYHQNYEKENVLSRRYY